MSELDKIMINQALIMRALAILLVPGDRRAVSSHRSDTADHLFTLSELTRADVNARGRHDGQQ